MSITSIILLSLASSLAINLVLFLIAFKRQSDKLTDISYAISFLTINIVSFSYAAQYNLYSWVLFVMVLLWAVRIGAFLLIRVLKVGKDKRFDTMRPGFISFGKFWLGQALTAWILMLPVTIALYRGESVTNIVYVGLLVWLVGLIIETLADYQKFSFKQNPRNRGKWIQEGIWRHARHPNYLGEIMVWTGIYLVSFPALTIAQRLICLASPLLITFVLLKVSGVPILERSADERWGNLKEYKTYKQNTRLLLPIPKQKLP